MMMSGQSKFLEASPRWKCKRPPDEELERYREIFDEFLGEGLICVKPVYIAAGTLVLIGQQLLQCLFINQKGFIVFTGVEDEADEF